jgi:hypothetical protein
MTDYTKTVNFAAKDSLPSGDSGKIIRGTEFDTEFNNISTAVATKADEASPTFTGTATFNDISTTGTVTTVNLSVTGNTTLGDAPTDTVLFKADVASSLIPSVNNTHDIGAVGSQWKDLYLDGKLYVDSIDFNGTDITATAAEINILDGVTASAAELNILDGATVSTTAVNYLTGVTSNIQTQLDNRLQKAGGTITGDVTFNQDVNLNIGTNSEMQLFRTATSSIIQETGGSDLFILSNGPNGVVLGKDNPFERSLRAMVDSGVELYYDNVLKTQTTANGLEVVGVTDTDQLRVTTPSVPASATATGTAGDIAWDADYIYVCTATDTWKRVAISTWS